MRIESDLIGQDAIRRIITEPVEMEIGDASYKFYMILDLATRSKKYYLGVGSTSKMQENDLLLLKLGNNETIKLTASDATVEKVKKPKDITILGGKQIGLSINKKVSITTTEISTLLISLSFIFITHKFSYYMSYIFLSANTNIVSTFRIFANHYEFVLKPG